MQSPAKLEQSAISALFGRAAAKLRILNTNLINDDLRDPTGSFSIGEALTKKIDQLEAVQHSLEDIIRAPQAAPRRPSEKRDSVNWWQYARLQINIGGKEKRVNDQEALSNHLNEMYSAKKEMAIASTHFVEKWEIARREQLIKSLQLREKELREETAMGEYQVSTGLEAARRIDEHYSWQLAKVETDINDWMERFDREKDDIESRFQKARAKKKRWDEMKAEVEQRKEEVVRLEELERKYIEDAEHRRMCEKFAVRIQAWWRGVMVRKGFGPYGKGKKAKGKKGAKGAKKGKAKKSKK